MALGDDAAILPLATSFGTTSGSNDSEMGTADARAYFLSRSSSDDVLVDPNGFVNAHSPAKATWGHHDGREFFGATTTLNSVSQSHSPTRTAVLAHSSHALTGLWQAAQVAVNPATQPYRVLNHAQESQSSKLSPLDRAPSVVFPPRASMYASASGTASAAEGLTLSHVPSAGTMTRRNTGSSTLLSADGSRISVALDSTSSLGSVGTASAITAHGRRRGSVAADFACMLAGVFVFVYF